MFLEQLAKTKVFFTGRTVVRSTLEMNDIDVTSAAKFVTKLGT